MSASTSTSSTGQSTRERRPRVVVVGGGFAGLAAVRELSVADADVTLLDRHGFNTFQPLLYQVATGGLNPGDVTYALRAFASKHSNTSFRRATVVGLDLDGRRVLLDHGDPVEYDYLIIGCGVTANYFGIPGAAEYAHTIYTRRTALESRDQLLSSIEEAAQGRENALEPVVVVVGGGATGVEMAGAIAEMRNKALPATHPELDISRVRVILVEMMDEVLGPFHAKLRSYAAKALAQRGVELRLGTAVKEVHPDRVVIGDGEEISNSLTIWATGVAAHPQVEHWGLPQGRGGRVLTDPDLRVQGRPEVFAVGDVGAVEGDPSPQLAQPAIQGGAHAAVQIRRLLAGSPTAAFHYKDKGTMATIGRSDAVVQLPSGVRMKGFAAWLAWVGLHIVTLTGHRNRMATLINLSVRYFSQPGSLNVIVGEPRDTRSKAPKQGPVQPEDPERAEH